MYFLYYFIACYSSILIATVSSYVVLVGNLHDFKTIIKKIGSENLATQIEDMVEGRYNARKLQKTKEQNDEINEYSDENARSQQDTFYEITTPTVKLYRKYAMTDELQSNEREKVSHGRSSRLSELTVDDIVMKVKQKLHQELLSNGGKAKVKSQRERIPLGANKSVRKKHKKSAQLPSPTNFEQNLQAYDINPPDKGVKEAQFDDDQVPEGSPPQVVQKPVKTKMKHGSKVSSSNAQKQGRIKKKKRVQHVKDSDNQVQRDLPKKLRKTKKEAGKKIRKTTPMTTLEAPQVDNEAVAANLESIPSPNHGDQDIFEAVNLQKSHDSYEDYVTPAKEDMFESEEATTSFSPFTINLNPKTSTAPTAVMEALAEDIEETAKDGVVEYEVESPKAQTESVSYEEKETISDSNVTSTDPPKVVSKKPKLGTMIPTREFYKLSSPNYYGKLPTVAEKYNFDEPIPEADREHEDLKPIANPPSSVNGKVKLS
ncbi:uncharacterized protein LOC111359408 [Spodoptera litura]|uniref:Uncharacterized protein LOC111359408 n=1 Tax=Spodoptera litura TaxID=69820 RepID=A0A9J7EH19_SPOLT|nr:uncharacterized protein LOC111359408 [Spodoptera litura]